MRSACASTCSRASRARPLAKAPRPGRRVTFGKAGATVPHDPRRDDFRRQGRVPRGVRAGRGRWLRRALSGDSRHGHRGAKPRGGLGHGRGLSSRVSGDPSGSLGAPSREASQRIFPRGEPAPAGSLSSRKVIQALERAGFLRNRARGSHHFFIHPSRPDLLVVVPHHGGDLRPGTLRWIIIRAGDPYAEHPMARASTSAASNR